MSSKNALLFFGIFSVIAIGAISLYFVNRWVFPKLADEANSSESSGTPSSNTAPTNQNQSSEGGTTAPPKNSGGFFSSFFNFDVFSLNLFPQIGPEPLNDGDINSNNGSPDTQKSPEEIAYEIEQTKLEVEKIQESLEEIQAEQNASSLKGKIKIENVSRGFSFLGNSSASANEYVTIRASSENTVPIRLTGLRLQSSESGRGDTIGEGVVLPYINTTNPKQAIEIAPGGVAYVITGRSPIGYSFRSNICTGYFEQFQDFTPGLYYECPIVRDEPRPASPNALPDNCIDYLDSFPRCQIRTSAPPQNITTECLNYLDNHVGYNYCVSNHKNDIGFAKKEWHVYLFRDDTLWKDRRETIELLDPNGKIIDSYSY